MMRPDDLPTLALEWPAGPALEQVLPLEWIVTNGLGGFASGTVAGVNTRRYHGLFIPALPVPHGRTVLLPRISQCATVGERSWELDGAEHLDGPHHTPSLDALRAFRLEGLVPVWDFALGPARLRRRLTCVHGEETVVLQWMHLGGPPIRLALRPFVAFRFHHLPPIPPEPVVRLAAGTCELYAFDHAPAVRVRLTSREPAPFIGLPVETVPLLYRVERSRGMDHAEVQRSPGYFEPTLLEGDSVALVASVEDWESLELEADEAFALEWERERRLLAQAPPPARVGPAARLVLAADQFIIEPASRPADEAWARATGQDARSVIAGYHWFTDWGRDTMISLEGLTLSTGRVRQAAATLRTFQHYVRDGLLPNLFPEGSREGLYHTADATLWFFHAAHRYLRITGDEGLLRDLYPTLERIIEHHVRGTRFGIGVDPRDGLLRQGADGYQLTWMDAKVDDWVVTPRRGKAVEINALWFNALRLMAEWAPRVGATPAPFLDEAERVQGAFNRRFWNEVEGCLYDVVDGEDGDDPAVRPNQVFAISLPYPVLRRDRWAAVLHRVQEDLLTPVGLRSLSPSHAAFQATYDGDLRARDAAYHQGTVWAWLIGHFVDAHLRTFGDPAAARGWLLGLVDHLGTAGLGTISEIFDASAPFRARGCIAQAWSVAEVLRAWLATDETLSAAS